MQIELEEPHVVVPEGVTIAPVHYLNIPHSEELRDTLEADSDDIHTIVKLTWNGHDFELETFGQFKEVVSQYCFQTGELVGQPLCHLATASFLSSKLKPLCFHHSQPNIISVT